MSARTPITRLLIVKNGIFSLMSWVFPILITLIVTPVIVKGLGLAAYGLFAAISGFISYSFTFSIGKAASKYVSELNAKNETDRLSAAISAVFLVSLFFGLVAVGFVGLTADYLVSDVLRIPAESHQVATSALYVAGITILLTMVSQVFQFTLQGLHRFDRFLLIANIAAVVLSIGNVILVLNGFGVVALIVWNCCLVALGTIVFAWTSMRLLAALRPTFSIDSETWRTVISYAVSIVGYQTFGNALLLFERGWIVRKFGMEPLSYYVVPMGLGFYFHGLVASLVIVLFPVVNQLVDDREKLLRVYRTSTKIILALTAFYLVTMTVTGKPFLRTWMGESFAELSYRLLVIHALTFAVISIATVAWQLTEAFGVAKLNAIAGGVWFSISVPLMVVLSETWQTEGVAIARLIGVFAMVPLIGIVEHRYLGGILTSFWLSLFGRLAVAIVGASAVQWLAFYYFTASWLAIGFAGALSGLVFVASLWLVGFVEDDERTTVVDLFSRVSRSIAR